MRGLLLTLIEKYPDDATKIFLTFLEKFSKGFVKGPSLEHYFLRSVDFNCILSEERIIEIASDNVEEKIIGVIRMEIEKNFTEFHQFLINPSLRQYSICCQLDNCVTVIDVTSEHDYIEVCEYKFEISKIPKSPMGFYIQGFKPISPLKSN